jgi:hypothetical protein
MQPLIDLVCQTDPKLKDILYSAYVEWRTSKLDFEAKKAKLPKLSPEKVPENLDSPDQSVIHEGNGNKPSRSWDPRDHTAR